MNIKFKKLAVAAITLLTPVASLSTASAATQQLEITPTSLVASLDKGTSLDETLTVVNPGTTAYNFKVYATPFSVTGEDYTQNFNPIKNAENVGNWFTFSSTTYHIEPNQTLNVQYRVNAPKNALAGGHYATLFVETTNTADVNGVVIHDRLGAIAYLTVNGPVKTEGSFLTWSVPYLQRPNLTADVRIQNTGGVHFESTINATVKDIFGGTKFTYSSKHEILPQTIRKIPVVWPKTPSFGLYKISGDLTYLGNKVLLPGKYVLIMSTFVRMVTLLLILLIAVWVVVRIRYSGNKMNKGRGSKYSINNLTKSVKKVSKTANKTVKKSPAKKTVKKNNSKTRR